MTSLDFGRNGPAYNPFLVSKGRLTTWTTTVGCRTFAESSVSSESRFAFALEGCFIQIFVWEVHAGGVPRAVVFSSVALIGGIALRRLNGSRSRGGMICRAGLAGCLQTFVLVSSSRTLLTLFGRSHQERTRSTLG